MSDTDDLPIEIYEEVLHYYDTPDFVSENRAPTLDEQNEVFEWYKENGIIDGCPGSWSTEYILSRIAEIEASPISDNEKYFLLDSLSLGLDNNYDHPLGDWSMWNYVNRKVDKYI